MYLYSMDNDECRDRAGHFWDLVTNTTLCAASRPGYGACFGDSGGALVSRGKLIGIASWVSSACGSGGPIGFTRISTLLNWVFEISGIPAV